jgi:hypothetical protein
LELAEVLEVGGLEFKLMSLGIELILVLMRRWIQLSRFIVGNLFVFVGKRYHLL